MKGALLVMLPAVLLLSAACVDRRVAQTPYVWQLRGALVDVQETAIRVRHKSGQEVVLSLDERTRYVCDNRPASATMLKVGSRVMVDVQRVQAANVALRVEILSAGTP
jgi:hypothetical protein